jgi:hypothetical protein
MDNNKSSKYGGILSDVDVALEATSQTNKCRHLIGMISA